jgi:hypothetical protein
MGFGLSSFMPLIIVNRITLTFGLLFSTIVFSLATYAEEKMIPLSEYVKSQNMEDPNVLFYTSTRCAAINFRVAYQSQNDDKQKELYERSSLTGETFSQMAILVRQTTQSEDTPLENKKAAVNVISLITEEYGNIMNDNYVKTGEYFTDWMIEDLSTCSRLYELARK